MKTDRILNSAGAAMEYRTLGRTDIQVSSIALGCWALAGDGTWGEQSEADSIATVHAAIEEGITLFDTAEAYGGGASERVLGKALAGGAATAGRRDKVVIASKASPNHAARADLIQACERSLERLGTDYIDLYQIHWPSREVPLDETFEALETLKAQGKVRATGVSNFGVKDLGEVVSTHSGRATGRCETNQLPYSLLWRAIEYEILPLCQEHEIGVLCYSPLAQGLLTGKFLTASEVPEGRARTRHFSADRPQVRHGGPGCEAETFEAIDRIRALCLSVHQPMGKVALAWLRHQPGVTSVLAGARRPEQVRQNVQAAELRLSQELLDQLDEVTDPVKQAFGANPDMWQAESRMK